MKRSIVIVIVSLTALNCKKDANSLQVQLQGTWELRSAEGGWIGYKEYEPGNGNTITFDGNNFVRQTNAIDTVYTYDGNYSIYNGKPCETAPEETLIKFNNDGLASVLSISGGELTIGDNQCMADGQTSTYRKILP